MLIVRDSAFKFMPVLGRYVADCFENLADEALRHKWRFRSSTKEEIKSFKGDGSRGGPPRRELDRKETAKL